MGLTNCKSCWSLALIVWASLLIWPAQARSSAEPLVAVTVPVLPWTFPAHPDQGVAPEYLAFLFHEAGIPLKLETQPYLRAINSLRDGNSVAALLIPDAERDQFALRLCEVTTIRSGVIYKKARFHNLDVQHLAGLMVGVPLGTHALDKLNTIERVLLHHIDSVSQGIDMLKVDHLDASFLSSPGSNLVLEQANLSSSDFGWLEVDSSPVVVYISRNSPIAGNAAAMARLKTACEGKARPVMEQLMRKYH
jgi:polar amino acid transport system substrate-binding protein